MAIRQLTPRLVFTIATIVLNSSLALATTYRPITLLFGETACLRGGGTVVMQDRVKMCATADVTITGAIPSRSPSQGERMKLPYEDDPKAGEPSK